MNKHCKTLMLSAMGIVVLSTGVYGSTRPESITQRSTYLKPVEATAACQKPLVKCLKPCGKQPTSLHHPRTGASVRPSAGQRARVRDYDAQLIIYKRCATPCFNQEKTCYCKLISSADKKKDAYGPTCPGGDTTPVSQGTVDD
jgi:hypothetical protein